MERQVVATLVAALVMIAGFAPAAAAAGHSPEAQPADAVPGSQVGSSAPDPRVADPIAGPGFGDVDGADDRSDNDTDQGTTVTLLTYNDVQTAAAEDGNFPRMVTVVQQRRAAHDNPVVVAGGGDQVSPHALSPVSAWRAPIDVLNVVEPDADVVGNHDLDYGFEAVTNFSAASEFPWLAANVERQDDGEPIEGVDRYEIVERDGVRIGFVGLVDEAIKGKTAVDFDEEGYRVTDYREVGPELARTLKEEENVDVVVALAHIGIPDSKELARADGGNYIDAIVVGDDEQRYPPQETAGSVIVEGQARAEFVGEVNMTVEDGDVVSWNGRLVNVTDDVPKNDRASSIINDYRAEVSLDSTAGTSETPLDARFATNYHRESGYGNLITDAMRADTGADVAITNAGGIRSNQVYGPGEITGGDVFNTLPFSNTIVVVELTGAELKETLASQVVTLGSPTGQQFGAEISQQVSGVTFEWVPHEDADQRIRDVRVGGEPLDEDATYTVAVNSFIAGGGSGYYPLVDAPRVERTGKLLATSVIDYLNEQGTVSPEVEGRMRRVTATDDAGRLRLDGDGVSIVTVDLPATATSVDADSWRAISPGADGQVEPVYRKRVEKTGKLWLWFRDADLRDLATAGDGEVDIYANYTDSRYEDEWVYWDGPVLGVEVDVTIAGEDARLTEGNADPTLVGDPVPAAG